MPPLAVLAGLVDAALIAIEHAVEPLLPDDQRGGNRGEPPPYEDGDPMLAAWAPGARVRLGDLSVVLERVRPDVELLSRMGTARGHERWAHAIAQTLRHHEAVRAVVHDWLALAKSLLAQQRGDAVDPGLEWERAWRARDAAEEAARRRPGA
jgi:hypothetical protein